MQGMRRPGWVRFPSIPANAIVAVEDRNALTIDDTNR